MSESFIVEFTNLELFKSKDSDIEPSSSLENKNQSTHSPDESLEGENQTIKSSILLIKS